MNAFLLLTLLVVPCLGMRRPYVIGGAEVTDATKHPYMVSLQRGSENICGGAIISSRFVITAAHCVTGKIDFVVSGRLSIEDDNKGTPIYHVPIGYIRHEDYIKDDAQGNPNDVAVIKLQKAVVETDTTKIIPMATDADTASFKDCVVMGWGHTETGILPKPTPDKLHSASVNIFTQDFCKGRWTDAQINDNHVCAGVDGSKGGCSSDGGGPLACDVGGTVKLAGVMSFSAFTCGPSTPTVYSRVSKFKAWVEDTAGL